MYRYSARLPSSPLFAASESLQTADADIESINQLPGDGDAIVDMEKLIADMMARANVTEDELKRRGVVHTDFGEDLSWDYLCYVRSHPICWDRPTAILYGDRDELTSLDTIRSFAEKHNADLTVMENGGHWFHTEEQMRFLDEWIIRTGSHDR